MDDENNWGDSNPNEEPTSESGGQSRNAARRPGFKGTVPEIVAKLMAPTCPFRFAHNTFSDTYELNGKQLTDSHHNQVQYWIEQQGKGHATSEKIAKAIYLLCEAKPYNPLTDWFQKTAWDGQDYIGEVADLLRLGGEAERVMLRKFFISAIARAMQPGCQVDTVLVLVGAQGIKKSTFFQTLCPSTDYFTDALTWPFTKDELMKLQQAWIVELAEMDAIRKADYSSFKAAISERVDKYRKPYGRETHNAPRHSLFVATTNESNFLKDPTGNRRFWVLDLPFNRGETIDTDRLAEIRGQLWAQAFAAYQAGEEWYIKDATLLEEIAKSTESYMETDSWSPLILDWAKDKHRFKTWHVYEFALLKDAGKMSKADDYRVGNILRLAGYQNKKSGPHHAWWNPAMTGHAWEAPEYHKREEDASNPVKKVTIQ